VDALGRHEPVIRTTPHIARSTAIDISDTIPTMVGLIDVDDVATEGPSKNHDACVDKVSHHTAVATVIAAIEAVTRLAREPSMRRTARDKVSRLARAMAVAVHEASVRATSNAHAVIAQEYAPSPPFRWNSLKWWAHSDRGTTEATTMTLATAERSTCRRTCRHPLERRKVTTAGSVAATPIRTLARERRAKRITVVKASWPDAREARGSARAKCSEVFWRPTPATTKRVQVERTKSEPERSRVEASLPLPTRPVACIRSRTPARAIARR
jgi:hypothetical protein